MDWRGRVLVCDRAARALLLLLVVVVLRQDLLLEGMTTWSERGRVVRRALLFTFFFLFFLFFFSFFFSPFFFVFYRNAPLTPCVIMTWTPHVYVAAEGDHPQDDIWRAANVVESPSWTYLLCPSLSFLLFNLSLDVEIKEEHSNREEMTSPSRPALTPSLPMWSTTMA